MELNTLLRRILIVGLCAVPVLPLVVVDQFFFPFITGKNFAFRILVEILLAVWLLLVLRDPSMRPRLSGGKGWYMLPIVVLGLLVSAGISAALAENPHKAFWSNFERMEGWIGLLHSTAYFFIAYFTLTSEKLWSRFWHTSMVVSVIVGGYGLLQLGGLFEIHQGGVRVDGTLGNATYLAVYMLFHVFITLLYMVRNWSQGAWLKFFYGAALFLQVLMVFYAATRGTILGLAGGLLLFSLSLLVFGKSGAGVKKWAVGVLIAVIAIGGVLFLVRDVPAVKNHEVLSRIAGISLDQGQVRFTVWQMALQGVAERPVFGWGQEGFNYVFNKFYDPSLHSQEAWFDRAHNAFIDWLIAGGIPAFLLYVSFYALALWYLWRPGSTFTVFEKSLFTGLLAAYGFHNLFVFDNLISYVFFMSTLAYIFRRRSGIDLAPDTAGTPVSEQTYLIAAPVILIVTAIVIYVVNVPGIATASGLIQGLMPQCVNQQTGARVACGTEGAVQDLTINFENMKKADTTGLGRQEIAEQMLQFAVQLPRLQAGSPQLQQEVASYAATRMQQEIERAPNDARLELFLGSFYRQTGVTEPAITHITRALELSPKKQTIMFELGIIENDRGNFEAALEWFRRAHELYPDFETARVFYAATAIRAGQQELANQLLTERFGTATPDNDYILQAYLDVKDYARVFAIAEGRVAAKPQDAQLHVQLAAAYLSAGRRTDAIRALERAIELEPSFREQGLYFIEEIKAGRTP